MHSDDGSWQNKTEGSSEEDISGYEEYVLIYLKTLMKTGKYGTLFDKGNTDGLAIF